jgi:ribosomal protein L40E
VTTLVCYKCGIQIPNDSETCPKCGDKIRTSNKNIEENKAVNKYYNRKGLINEDIKKQAPKDIKANNIIGGIIFGIMLIGIIWLFYSCTHKSDGEAIDYSVNNQSISAWVAATNAVQNELKSPSTANFPSYSNSYVTDNNDGTYSVSSYVDAENSFGAKIRSTWSCTVNSSGNVSNIVINN